MKFDVRDSRDGVIATFDTEEEASDFASAWNVAYPVSQGFTDFTVHPA